jgi:DNA adenine methylase
MTAPTRPVLRYHGGKWRLAPWVLSFCPVHRTYCEPYGGAASVLMQKPRSYAEIYNDLNGDVVNLFRVLRDPVAAAQLRQQLELTPFAREEYERAYDVVTDPVDRARRVVTRAFMGYGSGAVSNDRARGMRTSSSLWAAPTGYRSNTSRSGTTPAQDWSTFPLQIDLFTERLQGVVIEQRPALEVFATHDREGTLTYLDPPYVHSTRNVRRDSGLYTHELTDEDHRTLAMAARGAKGMVILSGYHSALYDELYHDWPRFERASRADRGRKRIEVLWMNPACAAALERERSQGVLL